MNENTFNVYGMNENKIKKRPMIHPPQFILLGTNKRVYKDLV